MIHLDHFFPTVSFLIVHENWFFYILINYFIYVLVMPLCDGEFCYQATSIWWELFVDTVKLFSDCIMRSFLRSSKYLMGTIYWHNEAVLWLQFVSLVDPSISVDCEILRDCYEAFAMYCFGRYLVACLGRTLSIYICVFSYFVVIIQLCLYC